MDFEKALRGLAVSVLCDGDEVDTGHWQAMKGVPQTKTLELSNVVFGMDIPGTKDALERLVAPSTPWAEAQFQERVGGKPLNPGETFKLWPWYRGNVEQHKEQGQFSHTYMERFWPKWAGQFVKPNRDDDGIEYSESVPAYGIRYDYGDLNDVKGLLEREPTTRQAYLPVFFPEDTGAHHGERIPCSLGYHFMLRQGRLHCTYFIRSCDLIRHFRDDVYLACRLTQWLRDKVEWPIEMTMPMIGKLTMHMVSLHVFEGDKPKLERIMYGRE